MKIRKLLSLRGTKYAYIGLAMLANVIWIIFLLDVVLGDLARQAGIVSGLDIAMILGAFLGCALIAFIITLVAKDGRGPTYGIYGGLAGLVAVVILAYASGLLTVLVGLTALLGGFNGGMLGEGFRYSRKKK